MKKYLLSHFWVRKILHLLGLTNLAKEDIERLRQVEMDICTCVCHYSASETKTCMVPCCSTCSRCRGRIKRGWKESHKRNCPAQQKT